MTSVSQDERGASDADADALAALALRRAAHGVLARARPQALARHWADYAAARGGMPAYTRLRGPETGLTMVRGRIGGTGAPFNLGEAVVTRCSLRIAGGPVGHAHVLGRDRQQAETTALVDALLQLPGDREVLQARLIAPLAAELAQAAQAERAESAATRVEFFTLVRGEDP